MLPYINTPFAAAGQLIGASADELKLITSFLLSYPLAGILKRIPDSQPWKKNAFIIAVSLFYLVGLFDLWDGVRTLLYCSAGAYAIAYYVDGSIMPWIGFAYLIGYMSVSHIIRQIINDPSTIDVTGAQMVLVMKLSAFCWNVHDGRLPESQLSDAQKHAAIKKMPGLLDFAGYVLFFPSLLAGPAFDYVEYRRWIETTMFDLPPGVDPSKAPPTRKKRKIPRSGRPAMWKAAMGLAFVGAFVVFAPIYTTNLLLSDEYAGYGFLRRVWVLYVFGFAARLKYYGVWALAEGACILSGMGYNGVDRNTGQVYWNKLENVNSWGLETAQNPHAFLANWNKNTNHWLRNYVYLRVTPKGKKPGFRASLATFATSAVWHGFYPGYYLTFILGSFVQTSAKHFRRHVRPFFLSADGTTPTPYKKYYDVVSWLATQLTMSFVVAPFILLDFADCITLWGRLYFYTIIGIIATLVFFNSPAKAQLTRMLNQRNKKASGTAVTGKPSEREAANEAAAAKARAKAQADAKELRAGETPYTEQPLGLPNDLAQDVEDAVHEMKKEIETRRRRGSLVTMPTGAELRIALEQKLGKALSDMQ
ncbi:lysophospholipid acyltransferase [Arthroderma uncinatum]|uniref:lysophospholipid acyltransferase n=1 Tax=Arthroderma uncinatum TaxID=74035 RepID=UPI00144A9D22|nr:lysophospholipid acyltransferase [Arthroderma uncinatum]KAF3483704.1 lysophospholipid acyltransferase [Arthroderma uncinatum]